MAQGLHHERTYDPGDARVARIVCHHIGGVKAWRSILRAYREKAHDHQWALDNPLFAQRQICYD